MCGRTKYYSTQNMTNISNLLSDSKTMVYEIWFLIVLLEKWEF